MSEENQNPTPTVSRNHEALNAIMPQLDAIPPEEIFVPTMPVGIYIQEAEDLQEWVVDDKVELLKYNLNWTLVEELSIRTGGLRGAQSIWQKEYRSQEEAQLEWKTQLPFLTELRNQLQHFFLFAFRNEPQPLAATRRIDEGESYADMLQDLADLAELGRGYPEPLAAINFDTSLLEQADRLSSEMADLLARANGEKGHSNNAKIIRDRAYSYLKKAVDEIREYGKFTFYRTPLRLKGYSSNYLRSQNKKTRNNHTENNTSSEVDNSID